ncbi:MAG: hypothetical protein K6G88_01385 [Lachnospiraceae bacterium]|nr:hypothetical protein [Lachnospiraceae bacterium]
MNCEKCNQELDPHWNYCPMCRGVIQKSPKEKLISFLNSQIFYFLLFVLGIAFAYVLGSVFSFAFGAIIMFILSFIPIFVGKFRCPNSALLRNLCVGFIVVVFFILF